MAGFAGFLGWLAQSGVVQGVIIGATLAFLSTVLILNAVARAVTTTAGGWRSIRVAGRPENGVLLRAATAKALPLVNVVEEAAYWTASTDGAGRRLDGRNDYVLTFPAGQLPPNDAFWSLTATDPVGYLASGTARPARIDDRSGLVANADGSIDVLLRRTAPEGRERNWLPTPAGRFALTLRAYLPGQAVLDGDYRVPPVVQETRG